MWRADKRETLPSVKVFWDTVLWSALQSTLSIGGLRKGYYALEAAENSCGFNANSLEVRLMVEFIIKVNQQRTAYIPKEVIENLGYDWFLVPDTRAAVIYARKCDLETVIKSLEVILEGLRLRLTEQHKGGVGLDF